jgi:hypothetical protein
MDRIHVFHSLKNSQTLGLYIHEEFNRIKNLSSFGLFWSMDCDMDLITILGNLELHWCKRTKPYNI